MKKTTSAFSTNTIHFLLDWRFFINLQTVKAYGTWTTSCFVSYAIRRFFIFGLFFYFLLCLISYDIIQFVIDCQTCSPPIYNNRSLVLSSLPTEGKRRKAGVSRFCWYKFLFLYRQKKEVFLMLNANVAFANGANHIGEVRTVSVRELAGVSGFIFGMAVSVAFATGLAQLIAML